MRPMLDDLELPQVQRIDTSDQRALAQMRAPGMAGTLLQNLGRRPTRLVLSGVASGPEALTFAKKVDEKFRARKPVPFTADIVADAKIDKVLIDDLRLQDLAGRPDRFAYVLALREFIEPAEPAEAEGLDANILDDAKNLVDGVVDGLDIGQAFATGLEKFVTSMGGFLSRLQQFRKDTGGGGN
jgi:hypothetical protein